MSEIMKLYKTVVRDRWEIGFVEGGLARLQRYLKHGDVEIY